MGKSYTVVELLGDGISSELSQSVHTVAESLPFGLDFVQVDLSDENRRKHEGRIFDSAVAAMLKHGTSIKYPTATTVESPNKILRERCHFSVIHRPVCTVPGVPTNFKLPLDIDVVRIATGGTYEDHGRRIGRDTAVSLRVIERQPCHHAARFAFKLAQMRGTGVVSSSKYTIQQATDGLFEEVVGNVAQDYPATPYRRELFDALLAGMIMFPDRYAVIVTPNEYGDFLSDAACGLIGSVGLGDSASYAFSDTGRITVAMFDPAGGTAPDIAGQNLANPAAALLALGNMVKHLGERESGDALKAALFRCIEIGKKTHDVGGKLSTTEFTEAVIEEMKSALATS